MPEPTPGRTLHVPEVGAPAAPTRSRTLHVPGTLLSDSDRRGAEDAENMDLAPPRYAVPSPPQRERVRVRASSEPPGRVSKTLQERIRRVRLVAFDFDGVFTDNMVYTLEDGREMVRCSRRDGLGLNKLQRAGIETIIISTETNPIVTARSRKLRINCIQGCEDKGATLKTVAREKGLSLDQVAFVGNDINDLSCLTSAGLPIVVQDAHPDVIPHAVYRTRTPGGHGAVREVCDLFERVLGESSSQ